MNKTSFYRTLFIMSIIFISAVDFMFYYTATKMEEYSEQLIKIEAQKMVKIRAHVSLTKELGISLDRIKDIRSEINTESGTGEIIDTSATFSGNILRVSLQREKIKSIRLREKIVNDFGDLSVSDTKNLVRINYFYDKAIGELNDRLVAIASQEIENANQSKTGNMMGSVEQDEKVGSGIVSIKSSKVGILGIAIKDIPTSIQGAGANTCVIDNMTLALQVTTGKTLDKKYAYSVIGKKVGEMWNSGLYYIGPNGEGYINPMKKEDYVITDENKYVKKDAIKVVSAGGGYVDENGKKYSAVDHDANDFEKIRQAGIVSYDGNTYGKMTMYLEWKTPIVMEVPMSVLYPDEKKGKKLGIWHAISIFAVDTDTDEIIYSNTLSGKVERLKIDAIRSETDGRYLKYPFHIITVEKEKESVLFK